MKYENGVCGVVHTLQCYLLWLGKSWRLCSGAFVWSFEAEWYHVALAGLCLLWNTDQPSSPHPSWLPKSRVIECATTVMPIFIAMRMMPVKWNTIYTFRCCSPWLFLLYSVTHVFLSGIYSLFSWGYFLLLLCCFILLLLFRTVLKSKPKTLDA